MSQTIWTRCAGGIRARPLRADFCRVVEAQFRNSTRKLVDSDAEQSVLEALVDTAKAPVPEGFERLHWLLYTPFRHPPLRGGSRFGGRYERGILYGALWLPTALAEVAYYRLVFLEGTAADLGDVRTELTAFWFGLDARRAVDLGRLPFRNYEARLASKTSYVDSQAVGAGIRAAGVEACLFVSARAATRSMNVAVFENVFAPRRPKREQAWDCVARRSGVTLTSRTLIAEPDVHAFLREQFLVRGALPVPAV